MDQKTSKLMKKPSTKSNRKKKLSIVLMGGISVFVVLYSYWLNYIPQSTLQWEEKTDESPSLKELCYEPRQLYPPTSLKSSLPATSPDGKYYIDITDAKLGRKKILKLFKAENHQEIGMYYSSYSSLFIYCWDMDSSGVFISDHEPGGTGFGIFQRSSKIGPLKKLLVP